MHNVRSAGGHAIGSRASIKPARRRFLSSTLLPYWIWRGPEPFIAHAFRQHPGMDLEEELSLLACSLAGVAPGAGDRCTLRKREKAREARRRFNTIRSLSYCLVKFVRAYDIACNRHHNRGFPLARMLWRLGLRNSANFRSSMHPGRSRHDRYRECD